MHDLEVPKTTFRFNNSLGLTELSRATILNGTIYYNEQIHIKISNRKRHIGQEPGQGFQLSSTSEVGGGGRSVTVRSSTELEERES